jgi:hypothetical protein
MKAFIGPFLYSESPTQLAVIEQGAILVNHQGTIDQILFDPTTIPPVTEVPLDSFYSFIDHCVGKGTIFNSWIH